MVKSSVILDFGLGHHQRRKNFLHVEKKILGYRDLEAGCII
jgi:hypothetical protein